MPALDLRAQIAQRIADLAISRAEAARRASTTPAKVSDYLSGKTNPRISSVVRLAAGLGLDLVTKTRRAGR